MINTKMTSKTFIFYIIILTGSISLWSQERIGVAAAVDTVTTDLTLEQEQAAASVGQIELSKEYQEHFKFKGLICSQILITLDDFY